MWPAPLTPGKDWARDMGMARLLVEWDLEWVPERGEVVRGRYGIMVEGEGHEGWMGELHEGWMGEVGLGSVLRRTVAGLRAKSTSRVEMVLGLVWKFVLWLAL